MPTGARAVYSVNAGSAVLYSAGSLNTLRETGRTRRRLPETAGFGRDTPRLYALYSDVFSGHLHTNSARKPYCRKGFRKCIQCIQRIPTPFVFVFSLLLGREYMNTRPGGMMGHGRCFHHGPPPAVGNAEKHPLSAVLWRVVEIVPSCTVLAPTARLFAARARQAHWTKRFGGFGVVFSGPREYAPPPSPVGVSNAENGRNRPRHAPVVCIAFSCIQMPSAYKFGLKALLP